MQQVPIEDTIVVDRRYECDRELFPFINRNLNLLGMQGQVTEMSASHIAFIVRKKHAKPGQASE
jgi:hypothetical protein